MLRRLVHEVSGGRGRAEKGGEGQVQVEVENNVGIAARGGLCVG